MRCRHLLYSVSLVLAMVTAAAHADTLTGLADVTVVDGAIVSLRYEGTEYVVADGDLALGTTTRWYIDVGVETLWAEGDPAPAATVSGTSNPKGGDAGSKADNFLFTLEGSTNISSIDGIDYQETIFVAPSDTFFLFERGGNDVGTWQAILADGSLGTEVAFDKASNGGPYADTGVSVNGQPAHGVVFKTDVPVQGVRITASGHDTLSISTPAPEPILVDPNSDLAAAAATVQPGGRIEFAEGTYVLTAQLELKSDVTYLGAGAELTIIDGNNVTRAFTAWGDRSVANGQVDANGVSVPNLTGPTGWVLDGLTIQNCAADDSNRQDILSAARDLLNNYPDAPYTLATAQEENGGVTNNPEWFDILSGGADDELTDAELQAYLDANPVGSEGHLIVNENKSEHGAALIMRNGAEGTVRNCTFSNNSATAGSGDGGAINVDGAGLALAIDNCTFNGNACADAGGAVRLSGNDSVYTITDTTFTACEARLGGAFRADGHRSSYAITGVTIAECHATDDGGGIRVDADDSSYALTDCTFIGNTASDDGAAVRYGPDRAELSVTNCTFIGNGKDADGNVVGDDGVWITNDDDCGPMTFENCLFADNACNDDRLIELKAAFALLNCTFIGNEAGDKPLIAVRGRAWNSTGDMDENGDDIDDVFTDDSIIANCLFINNTMLSDGNVIGDTRDDIFAPTVINCLFYGNLDGENPASNTNDDSVEVGTIDVSGVTDAAQIVVDPAGDYNIAEGSPAIDASDPDTATAADIEGTPAVGVRDVGAYEFVGP